MKRTVLIALAFLVVAAAANAQGTVVGSKHDLSANLPTSQRVCVFCHTPHQPNGPPIFDVDPLWNHTLSVVASYGVYDSVTFDGSATITDLGGGTAVSNLCLSCHDGTVGLGSILNEPNIATGEETPTNAATLISGSALIGTDLTNDHPVNFTYDAALVTADGELNDPTVAPISDWLFGGTLQCASCHDVHDPTNIPFLRTSNVNSALCTTCHVK